MGARKVHSPTDLTERFVQRFRAIRRAQGLSQQTIVDRLPFHMDRVSLGEIESLHRSLRLDEAAALAEVLGTNLYAMIGTEPIEWTTSVD